VDSFKFVRADDHSPEAEQLRAQLRNRFAEHEQIMAQAPYLALDVSIPGLLPDRLVHLTRLTIINAYNVVRLEYEILPVDEPPSAESAAASRALGPWGWLVGGRDDQETIYDDHGGTYGVPPNGLVADGERDLAPAPPPDATWLEVTIHGGEADAATPAYTIHVDLPLRTPYGDVT
jgi:hypothetical protein